MNRIFDAAKIFVTGIFLIGIIFIGGKAHAAEVDAEAIQIFRETMLQTVHRDLRIFHQDIYFVMPKLTCNLEFLAGLDNDTLKLNGNVDFWMIDDKGNVEDIEAPFYFTQDKQNAVFYYQDEKKKWKKSTSPVSATEITEILRKPNEQEIDAIIDVFIKDVTVLQDSETSRILLVKFNGAKFVDMIKALAEKNPKFQEQTQDPTVNAIIGYLEAGFRNADIWYTWSVDKTTWQTTTISCNLSSLPQNIALAVLNDTSQPFASVDEIREILESVAFYSELKGYTTFLNADAQSKLEIPKKVLKAKEEKNDDKSKKK